MLKVIYQTIILAILIEASLSTAYLLDRSNAKEMTQQEMMANCLQGAFNC